MQTTTNDTSFPKAGWLGAWLRLRIIRGVARLTRKKPRPTQDGLEALRMKYPAKGKP